MKLLRIGDFGKERPALLQGDKIYDLSSVTNDIDPQLLSDLSVLSKIDVSKLPTISGKKRIGACVGNVGKLIGIGLNYADHAEEAGMPVPSEPVIFMKATSAICGANDDVYIPRGSVKTDWEVELGVVIGKPAKYVTEANAMQHVAGYCVINDVSEREFQIEHEGQWVKGKSADHFAPMGPYLVTRDEVPDPQALKLWLSVNDEMRQNGTTATMVYGVAHLVSYLSRFMTLHAGDVISTGTPPGVGMGMKPQQFLKDGDIVRLGIDGLGEQQQKFVDDK